jgi:hypothetical protein
MGFRPSRCGGTVRALLASVVCGVASASLLAAPAPQATESSVQAIEKLAQEIGRTSSQSLHARLSTLIDDAVIAPLPSPTPQEEELGSDPVQDAVDRELQELSELEHFTRVDSRWYRDPWAVLPGPAYEINEPGDKWWDPYRQNVMKGDFPIIGDDIFLRFTLTERALLEGRAVPTQAVLTSPTVNSPGFFGKDDQLFFNSKTAISFDLFKGQEGFKPVDWRVRVTPVFDYTLLAVSEVGNTNINITDDRTRITGDVSLQEALIEIHLLDLNSRFDFISSEVGILPFRSDFRGFIFDDINLGVRLFGTADENKWQYNLLLFHMLEKRANSELNTFRERDQQVLIANVYKFDFLVPGYNINFSFHWNHDQPSSYFNENDFLVRPAPVGLAREKEVDAFYLGFAGDGHFGRFNVTHAYYYAFGDETNNNFAARDVNIDAHFAALEVSYDFDWWRVRLYGMYSSGDDDPTDGTGEGFDAIMDFANFAGGENTFWMRQQVQLIGVGLTTRFSFLNDLTTSRQQGQANFVNPGLILLGGAVNYDLTPTLRGQTGYNAYWFDHTEVLEEYLFVEDVAREIGSEIYTSMQWRPLLTNNIIVNFGASVFFPGDGFEKMYQTDDTLYSVFLDVILTY